MTAAGTRRYDGDLKALVRRKVVEIAASPPTPERLERVIVDRVLAELGAVEVEGGWTVPADGVPAEFPFTPTEAATR